MLLGANFPFNIPLPPCNILILNISTAFDARAVALSLSLHVRHARTVLSLSSRTNEGIRTRACRDGAVFVGTKMQSAVFRVLSRSQTDGLFIPGWSVRWWLARPSAAASPDWPRANASSAGRRRTRCRRWARAPRLVYASAAISSGITAGTVPTCPTIRSSATWW
jgi:hypothetical protein